MRFLKQSNLRQQILLLMHSEKLQVFADFIVPAFQFRMLAGHIQQNHSFQFWEGYLLLKVTGVLHWGCRLTKPSMGIYLMDDLIWAVLHRMGIFTSITLIASSILNMEINQLPLFFSGLLRNFNLVALCQ
ncbi:hypothetical protein A9L51_26870 [Klebsiella pneumoniae]|nr:hypothetical protein A9L51_26870 [Klebsiella pneumoniae]OEG95484.1 hypothetical protein AN685_0223680 [Enterobacter roggenkampii]SAZ33630.1 Uncharacterised protein [Enterobacter kobei]